MLRFDTTLTAPDFETLALEYYHEIHDRTWETRQRIKQARTPLPSFGFQLEEKWKNCFNKAKESFATSK